MSLDVQWTGLDGLYAALRRLPAYLTDEARGITQTAADTAMAKMRAEYPPGELRDRLQQSTLAGGPFGVSIQIRNRSGWAWHWDYGTQVRHWTNRASRKSTGAEWGKSRPKHTFTRTMSQERKVFYDNLRALLTRAGLEVVG